MIVQEDVNNNKTFRMANIFSRILGYRTNVNESFVFIYTNNEHMSTKIEIQ